MNKKIIFVVVIAVLTAGLIIGGYFGWNAWKKFKINKEKSGADIEKTSLDSTAIEIPSVEVGVDPLENKPDVNPISNTNPFTNVKINPFE